MLFTEEELDNLSKLARIDITAEEKPKMLADMQAILSYISEINEVSGDITKEQESLYNVVREDIVTRETGSNTADILANAPKVKNGYVEVEQVLK
jgi:aspartyl/glutamyl-tRNA(Asn/Gln) amidotransferase C subunit